MTVLLGVAEKRLAFLSNDLSGWENAVKERCEKSLEAVGVWMLWYIFKGDERLWLLVGGGVKKMVVFHVMQHGCFCCRNIRELKHFQFF